MQVLIFTALTVLAVAASVSALSSGWKMGSDFPSNVYAGYYGPYAATIDDMAYVTAIPTATSTSLYTYNSTTRVWVNHVNFYPNAQVNRLIAAVDRKLLLTAGYYSNSPAMHLYDPDRQNFTVYSNAFPTNRSPSFLCSVGYQVLMYGVNPAQGQPDNYYSIFDVRTGAFTHTVVPAGYLSNRVEFSAARVGSTSKCVITGGHTYNVAGQAYATMDVYDFGSGVYTVNASAFATGRYLHASASYGTKTVFAGGMSAAGAYLDSMEMYDGTTGVWAVLAATLTSPRHTLSAGAPFDGSYLFFGIGMTSTGLSTSFDQYNTSTGLVSSSYTVSSNNHHFMVSAAVGTQFVLVGGYDGSSTYYNTMFEYESSNCLNGAGNPINPCLNGGQCRSNYAGTWCACRPGYVGAFCQSLPPTAGPSSSAAVVPTGAAPGSGDGTGVSFAPVSVAAASPLLILGATAVAVAVGRHF